MAVEATNTKTVFSVPEAAEYLSVTQQLVRTLIKRGHLHATKLGTSYRIRLVDLEQLLDGDAP